MVVLGRAGTPVLYRGAGIEPALQNQHRRHLIDDFAPAADGHVGLTQQTIGLGGGKALIPQVYRQLQTPAKVFGELAHLVGLRALVTTQSKWKAHDDLCHLIVADDFFQLLEVEPFILPSDSFEPLCRDPEGIGDSNANSPGTYVQPKNARVPRTMGRR